MNLILDSKNKLKKIKEEKNEVILKKLDFIKKNLELSEIESTELLIKINLFLEKPSCLKYLNNGEIEFINNNLKQFN